MFVNHDKFFQSEIKPMLEPVAQKCKDAGYGFIAAIKRPPIDGTGTVVCWWNIENLISSEQQHKIFSLLADSSIEFQENVRNNEE